MSATTACRRALLLLFAVCACGAIDARACSATAQDVFSVGNTAADSSCNYGSIQAAINAASCPVGTKIFINQSGDYTNQHLAITDKNITLIGRTNTPKCNTPVVACGVPPLFLQCPTAPLRTIDGSNINGSVVTVRGSSNVTVQYLSITDGNHGGGGAGGGIDFDGSGSLNLDTSIVSFNTADYGGGINFTGRNSSSTSTLTLGSNSQVNWNTANAAGSPGNGSGAGGGGIRIDGYAHLVVNSRGSWIWHNQAPNGNGGGILMVSGSASIGAVAYLDGPLIYQNEAQYGGGIAVFANSYEAVDANFYPVDASHPVRIEANTAHESGGAIYVKSYSGFSTSSWAYANMGGVRIDGNIAKQGSAIYSDVDIGKGAQVFFNASHCATGTECNSVSGNVAQDRYGTPTAGSAILLQTGAVFAAHALRMSGNTGDHAIRVVDSANGPPLLGSCLFDNNNTSAELVALGNASATIDQCTFVNNTNTSPGYAVVLANADLTLTNSIFAQGSQETLRNMDGGASMTLDYLMSGETDSLGGATHTIQADPAFVDSGNGDFHLRLDSLAIDYAPAGASGDKDLDNRPRDQDLPERLNAYGARDLGAYERQLGACDASDTIFCNGFDNP